MSEFLSAPGIVNALGCGGAEVAARLFLGDSSGMVLEEGWLPGLNGDSSAARVGHARGELVTMTAPEWQNNNTRNNQLLLTAVAQISAQITAAKARYGAQRIGVILGTSTSSIAEGEAAIAAFHQHGSLPAHYQYSQQEFGAPAIFLARYLGLSGPAYTVSTACTSSAKAFVSARNLLRAGLCDAVIVGGVDSLCRLTVNGFKALESTSTDLCQPLSANRCGINIGEGAAVFVMTREPAEGPSMALLGCGESSDAHHISAPHPQGLGAIAAMQAALADAGLNVGAVDYINLHATATQKNDEMESRAVAQVFPAGVPVSGTKPLTGHTLGAAGATELAFCWLALQHGKLPPHVWDGAADAALPPLQVVQPDQSFRNPPGQRVCMSNSFAFGGSNASLVLGDTVAVL